MSMKIDGDRGLVFDDGSAQSTAAAGKNLLINPFGDVQQRGALDGAGYFKDRWVQGAGITNPAWTVDKMADVCWQLDSFNEATQQMIERINLRRAWTASKKFTFSVYYHCTTGGNFDVAVFRPTATVDAYGSATNIEIQTVTLTPGTGRIEKVFTLPDEAFVYGAAVYIQSKGAGVAQFTGMKFEAGEVATPLAFVDSTLEMVQCQRYYLRRGAGHELGAGLWYGSNAAVTSVLFPTPMRISPLFISEALEVFHYTGGTGASSTAINWNTGNATGGSLYASFGASAAAPSGGGTVSRIVSGAAVFDAEIK